MEGRRVEEILRKQLDTLEELHGNQGRCLELQRSLIEIIAASQGAAVDVSSSKLLNTSACSTQNAASPMTMVDVETTEDDNREHMPGLVGKGFGIGVIPDEPAVSAARNVQQLSHWLEEHESAPRGNASFRQLLLAVSKYVWRDFFVPHSLSGEHLHARLNSKFSTEDYRPLKTSFREAANHGQLFAMLMLAMSFEYFTSLDPPQTVLDSVLCVIGFLMTVAIYVHVCVTTQLDNIMSTVSNENFYAWAVSNLEIFHFDALAECLYSWMALASLFLRFVRAYVHPATAAHAGWEIVMASGLSIASLFVTLGLYGINLASRSAVYSGAMTNVKIPVGSSGEDAEIAAHFYAAAVSGHTFGINHVQSYYRAGGVDGVKTERDSKRRALRSQTLVGWS